MRTFSHRRVVPSPRRIGLRRNVPPDAGAITITTTTRFECFTIGQPRSAESAHTRVRDDAADFTTAFAHERARRTSSPRLVPWTTSERVGSGSADACLRGAMRQRPGRRVSVLAFVQRERLRGRQADARICPEASGPAPCSRAPTRAGGRLSLAGERVDEPLVVPACAVPHPTTPRLRSA